MESCNGKNSLWLLYLRILSQRPVAPCRPLFCNVTLEVLRKTSVRDKWGVDGHQFSLNGQCWPTGEENAVTTSYLHIAVGGIIVKKMTTIEVPSSFSHNFCWFCIHCFLLSFLWKILLWRSDEWTPMMMFQRTWGDEVNEQFFSSHTVVVVFTHARHVGHNNTQDCFHYKAIGPIQRPKLQPSRWKLFTRNTHY